MVIRMSNKDVIKGIEIQAKADAAHEKKLAEGLKAHSDILESIAADQEQVFGMVGHGSYTV